MSTAQEIQIVNFAVGSVKYGVPVEQVREVRDLQDVVPVPGSPNFVSGMSNLRGRLITIIDLQKRLNIENGSNENKKIIIVETDDHSVGVIVDTVNDVSIISNESIQKNMELTTTYERYVYGVGKQSEELVVILNLKNVIMDVKDILPSINSNN